MSDHTHNLHRARERPKIKPNRKLLMLFFFSFRLNEQSDQIQNLYKKCVISVLDLATSKQSCGSGKCFPGSGSDLKYFFTDPDPGAEKSRILPDLDPQPCFQLRIC